jgi:hypothetical protein
MCVKYRDHRQIRVFVATRQYFAEAHAARVLGRIAERRTCVISVQGFTEFRIVPENSGVAKLSARFVLRVDLFRQLVHCESRNKNQKLFHGLVYKIFQCGFHDVNCS